ncbi:hypothetical protein DFJ74DRAFT_40446 [Hyaloraphidium curvatum]|nr:hypothetical protein DFJ74DRAFT_40446 [Hyaloraphidium curvatum]
MGRAREMASRYLANPALFLWPSDNQFQSLILAEKQKEQEFDRKNGRAPPSAFKPGHKKRLSLAGKMGRAVRGAISNQLREDDMQPLLRGAIDKLRSMDEEMLALHREAVQLRHLDRENELLDKLLKLSYRMFKAGEIAFGPPAFDASAPTAPKRKPPSRASDGKASQSSPIGQGRAAPPDVGVPVPSESSVADVLRLSEKLEAEMRKLSHELKRKPKAEEENRELRERFDIFQRIMNSDGLLFCPPPAAIPTAEDYMAL